MKILSLKTVHGPNVYHEQPVMVMTVDLGNWADTPSTDVPGFNDRMMELLPGLKQHTCSRGYFGGFVERLREGTYLAHIIEHVALELSTLTDIRVNFGKTRFAGEIGKYSIVTCFKSEEGMKICLKKAFELVNALLQSEKFDIQVALAEIYAGIAKSCLGPSTQALLDAAQKRGIPAKRIGENSLIQLGYGKNGRRIQAAVSDRTSIISADIAQDKSLTKELLSQNSIPTAEGRCIGSREELRTIFHEIGIPCVVKPVDGNHGRGVSLNITSLEEAEKAFEIAKIYSSRVLIEEMCHGRDYRVLVINGKYTAAAERRPPSLVGDGTSSIEDLILKTNRNELRGDGHDNMLTRIVVDEILINHLKKQNYTLSSVPKKDETVILRPNANLSSGGVSIDVTDKVHLEIRKLCERVARVVGLDICGIDIIHTDIAAPLNKFFKVIEVNAGPGLRMHLYPFQGVPRNVAEDIIEMIYPENSSARIPIASVTGTNGKTTVARMLNKIFSAESACVGLTTSDGIWIGQEKIVSGDTTGPHSASIVLSDPAVDVAILEVARGGLLRGGLAYDWSDVGVITNIREDHIGQDGIETLEDLVWIKSLVAERVRSGGTLVLNADDEESLKLKFNPKVQENDPRICLYSIRENNLAILSHTTAGGDACWQEDEWIFLKRKGEIHHVMAVDEIPVTMDGAAEFQISNALAAISAAAAMNVDTAQIAKALRSFNHSENLGRLNVYRVGKGYVILDYGHNTDALHSIGEMLRNWDDCFKTAVFGLPGDRTDELIQTSASVAAKYFNHFILKEDQNLRGRKPGEVSSMIERVIERINPDIEFQTIFDEVEAVDFSLNNIKENEVVVIFYESLSRVMPVLRQFDPIPIHTLPLPTAPQVERQGIEKPQAPRLILVPK